MRFSWWMAPLAVLLVLAGVVGGLVLSRPRAPEVKPGKVHAPPASSPQKPGGDKPATSKPPEPGPAAPQPQPKPPTEPAPEKPQPKRPSDKEAQAFLQTFMQARMAGDAGKVSTLVGPQAVGKAGIRLSGPGARITGYTADLLGSGDTDIFVFAVRVGFNTGQPGGEVAAEEITLTWKNGLKVAAYVEKPSTSLVVGKDGMLYLNKTLAGDLGLLPDQASPWGVGPGIEFGVGKDGWSVAAVNGAGTHVLWVTKGTHPLLGISQINPNGAPVMTPLDLLYGAGGMDAAWAPGSARYVAVAVAQPSGATSLTIYDLTGAQKYGPDLSVALGGGQDYAVRNLRWASGSVVAFDVEKGGNLTGPFTYDVTTKALKTP